MTRGKGRTLYAPASSSGTSSGWLLASSYLVASPVFFRKGLSQAGALRRPSLPRTHGGISCFTAAVALNHRIDHIPEKPPLVYHSSKHNLPDPPGLRVLREDFAG
jgi:hypothetical protein